MKMKVCHIYQDSKVGNSDFVEHQVYTVDSPHSILIFTENRWRCECCGQGQKSLGKVLFGRQCCLCTAHPALFSPVLSPVLGQAGTPGFWALSPLWALVVGRFVSYYFWHKVNWAETYLPLSQSLKVLLLSVKNR